MASGEERTVNNKCKTGGPSLVTGHCSSGWAMTQWLNESNDSMLLTRHCLWDGSPHLISYWSLGRIGASRTQGMAAAASCVERDLVRLRPKPECSLDSRTLCSRLHDRSRIRICGPTAA